MYTCIYIYAEAEVPREADWRDHREPGAAGLRPRRDASDGVALWLCTLIMMIIIIIIIIISSSSSSSSSRSSSNCNSNSNSSNTNSSSSSIYGWVYLLVLGC